MRIHPSRGVALAVLILASAALTGCGASTLEADSVNTMISSKVNELMPDAVVVVTCPADIPAKAGGTFDCPVTVNGQALTYTVTQTDDSGNLTAEPSDVAILDLGAAQTSIAAQFVESNEGSSGWEVTCNPEGSMNGIYIAKPASTFECSASGTMGDGQPESADVVVTVTDVTGAIEFETK